MCPVITGIVEKLSMMCFLFLLINSSEMKADVVYKLMLFQTTTKLNLVKWNGD